ncbi:hypothetical protein [Pseudohaliea rubra]|nr:hypothetical protein [Pseudohaliea rubra]
MAVEIDLKNYGITEAVNLLRNPSGKQLSLKARCQQASVGADIPGRRHKT